MEQKNIVGKRDIRLALIDNFPNHPYHVFDDADMGELVDSIEANGLLNPIIVRSKADGHYELISGHRRKRAYEILGLDTARKVIKYSFDNNYTETNFTENDFSIKLYVLTVKIFNKLVNGSGRIAVSA